MKCGESMRFSEIQSSDVPKVVKVANFDVNEHFRDSHTRNFKFAILQISTDRKLKSLKMKNCVV